MNKETTLDNGIRRLAIEIQRQKTYMEVSGLHEILWDSYWKLSETIWSIEKTAGINVPELRDAEDVIKKSCDI